MHTAPPCQRNRRLQADGVADRHQHRLEVVGQRGAERGAPDRPRVTGQHGVRARGGTGAGIQDGAQPCLAQPVDVVQALACNRGGAAAG
eukprot:scaffold10631_cov98-Isochrysis_galbana.AAC.3